MNNLTELKETRSRFDKELLALEAKVNAGTLTADEQTRFNALLETEIPTISDEIDAAERALNTIENAKKRSQSVNFGIGIKKNR